MGAIALIRLSGNKSISIADSIFRNPSGRSIAALKGGQIIYGNIFLPSDDTIIDEVVISLFRAPHSFTGEDTVEMACHGSTHIQRRILQLLIDSGARLARPGEFSKRAFLNGKMDLSQTEAVADLIASKNEAARRIAMQQMKGSLSTRLKELRSKIVEFSSLLELELDFSDQDVEFADRSQLRLLLSETDNYVLHLARSFSLGDAIKNGIPVAIIGLPNAGKSTLLNRLLGEDRAIVSDIPGTTRDSIEETIHMGDVELRLIDTAGIRHTTDTIESIGIERALNRATKAMVILLLVDVNSSQNDINSLSSILKNHINKEQQHILLVINKIDTNTTHQTDLSSLPCDEKVCISALDGQGMEQLQEALVRITMTREADNEDIIITNARHYEALIRAHEALTRVQQGIEANISGEFISLDIHDATDALAEITGEISSQEILNNIFSKFCIGK